MQWEDQMPELRKIRESFTKKVAQDIFDILTPTSASGRSTHQDIDHLVKVDKDSLGAEIPFFIGSKGRSNVDEIASFNRIPSDRAQDAIVYFIEEILRLKELKSNLKISEKKKKTTSKEPTRDEDEEVFQKQYILTADENGILHRLTISHTFLKIEERSFRPSATKTKKTRKPVYQLCWKPIRASKTLGQFKIVSYPTETVMYNNRTSTIERIPFKDDSLDKWTNAVEIGKSNLIAMASDLRNTCYLILFEGQEPYQALLESDILKYFKIVSDLIYNETKLDPFGFRKLGEEIRIRKHSKPKQEIQEKDDDIDSEDEEIEFSTEIKGSPFGESFIFTKAEFLPSLIGDVPSPAFRIDIVDEQSVATLLFERPSSQSEISDQQQLFRHLSEIALKNPLPTLEDATKPFRSLWFLNGACNFEINYQSAEDRFEKEKTKIKQLSPDISVGSRTKARTKAFKIENRFVLHLKFLEKNSVAFILGPASASNKLKEFVLGDVEKLSNNPSINTQGLVVVGTISYGEAINEIDRNKLSFEIIKVWCAEKEKDTSGHISQNVLQEYGSMYFEFLCNLAKLYALPKQKSYLYMDLAVKDTYDSQNSNLSEEDLKYLLDSVIFTDPEEVTIGDSSAFIRQQLSLKGMREESQKTKGKGSMQKSTEIVSQTPNRISVPQPPIQSQAQEQVQASKPVKAQKSKPILNLKTQPTLVENAKVVNVLDAENLEINDNYPRGMDQDIPLAKEGISETELIEYINQTDYVRNLAKLSANDIYQIDTSSLVPIAVLWDGEYVVIGNPLSALILQHMYLTEDIEQYDAELLAYKDEISEQISTHQLNANLKAHRQPILLQVIDLPDLGDMSPDEQQGILSPYLKQFVKGILPAKTQTPKTKAKTQATIIQPSSTQTTQSQVTKNKFNIASIEEIDGLLKPNSIQNQKTNIQTPPKTVDAAIRELNLTTTDIFDDEEE